VKEIDDLVVRLRGEMSSRIDDRDIVDILEVLQEADERIENLNFVLNTKDNYIEKLQNKIEELKEDKEWIYETFADI
jgi:predicted  nucleic acid-binding Zn-ribbon protein